VLAGAGRVQEAISHFETALRIDPNSAEAHINLGIALSGIPGRTPEAIQHFKAALRIKPDPEIQQMLNRLEKQKIATGSAVAAPVAKSTAVLARR